MARDKSSSGRGVQGKPGRRYQLTDEPWQRIEPLLPKQGRGNGVPPGALVTAGQICMLQ